MQYESRAALDLLKVVCSRSRVVSPQTKDNGPMRVAACANKSQAKRGARAKANGAVQGTPGRSRRPKAEPEGEVRSDPSHKASKIKIAGMLPGLSCGLCS